jgi:tetratricopeptide (TPR) repeat protein
MLCEQNACVPSHPAVKAVQTALIAGFQRHDLNAYKKLWHPSGEVRLQQHTSSKTPEVRMTTAQNLAVKRIRFHGPSSVRKLNFRKIFVSQKGKTLTLEWLVTIHWTGSSETNGERYVLQKSAKGWEVLKNATWPIARSLTFNRIQFTPQRLRSDETKARAYEKNGAWKQALFSYWNCWKFGEALRLMRKVTKNQSNFRMGWVWRGFAALAAGRAKESLNAYQKAWQLNPNLPLPGMVKGLIGKKKAARPTKTVKPTSRPARR